MVTLAPSRPLTATLSGAVVAACAVVAAGAALAPMAIGRAGGPAYVIDYLWMLLPLVTGLAGTGVLMAGRPSRRRPAAAAAAVLAAQVTGYGVVAVRDWFNIAGAGPGMPAHRLATVVTVAAAMALAGAVAATIGVARLWREPAGGWRALVPRRPGWVAGGAAVAVLVPPGLAAAIGDTDITTLGQFGLTFGLPWGAGLALAGWLRPDERTAVASTVLMSAVLAASQMGFFVVASLVM